MSKSNTRYIATVAFAQGFALLMSRHYKKLEGRERFKQMILEMYKISDEIIVKNPDKITDKEADQIKKAVEVMNHYGLENAKSYQTYISFLVALISERLEELSRSKKQSPKTAKLETLMNKVLPMYDYYAQRTRNDELDQDALKLLNNFNCLFK